MTRPLLSSSIWLELILVGACPVQIVFEVRVPVRGGLLVERRVGGAQTVRLLPLVWDSVVL